MMNDMKKNELNELEMENVTGGAFRSVSPNQNEASHQGEGIGLTNAVSASFDADDIAKHQAISFLRTDSMP